MSLTRAQTTQLTTPVPRPQPYRVTAPMDAQQAEHIDEMFQILFDDNRNGATIPMNIEGDLLYFHLGAVTRFPIGVANRVLRCNGTDPLWGQVVLTTDVTGVLPPANGGLGLSTFVIGDLLYASTTSVLSRLADVATGSVLISGGVGAAPSWGKVGLTTHVSGTLAVGNGGTGLATLVAGDVLYASAANTLAALAKNTSATRYLSNTGASNIPAWAQVALTTGVSGILPLANGGTALASVPTDGQLLIGRTSDNTFQLAALTAGANVTITNAGGSITIAAGSGGSPHNLLDASVAQDTVAHTVVKGDLVVGNNTPKWDALAVGTDGQALVADSTTTKGVKWGTASGSPSLARVLSSTGSLVVAGTAVVVAEAMEIAGGAIGEIESGALFEITGAARPASFGDLIAEVIFNGTTSNVTFYALPQTYRHLYVTFNGRVTSAGSGNNDIYVNFNGDGAANYDIQDLFGNTATATSAQTFGSAQPACFAGPQASVAAGLVGAGYMTVFNYADTNFNKGADVHVLSKTSTSSGGLLTLGRSIQWRSSVAIASVTFGVLTSGNFANGSRIAVYGVN